MSYAAGTNPQWVTVADVNHDGKLDLLVANFTDNTVSVLLGNGDETFQHKMDFPTGANPSSIAVGDFDADGNLDLAVTDGYFDHQTWVSYGYTVSILLGNGDGTFRTNIEFIKQAPDLTASLLPISMATESLISPLAAFITVDFPMVEFIFCSETGTEHFNRSSSCRAVQGLHWWQQLTLTQMVQLILPKRIGFRTQPLCS